MAPLTITISNQSGNKQSYALYAEAPVITYNNDPQHDVSTTRRIITSVRSVATQGGQAIFTMSKDWYALCGIYDVDTTPDENRGKVGSGTEVVDLKLVTLSKKSKDGTVVPGSMLEIESGDGTPSFAPNTPITRSMANIDGPGWFGIKTRADFTPQEARSNKFIVGITSARRQTIGAYITFVPLPNSTYLIKPSSTLYVTVGMYNVGDLILPSPGAESLTCRVDFDKLATDQVNVVQDDTGSLNILVDQPTQQVASNQADTGFAP